MDWPSEADVMTINLWTADDARRTCSDIFLTGNKYDDDDDDVKTTKISPLW